MARRGGNIPDCLPLPTPYPPPPSLDAPTPPHGGGEGAAALNETTFSWQLRIYSLCSRIDYNQFPTAASTDYNQPDLYSSQFNYYLFLAFIIFSSSTSSFMLLLLLAQLFSYRVRIIIG